MRRLLLAVIVVLASAPVLADEHSSHMSGPIAPARDAAEEAVGHEGDPAHVSRTVKVFMTDQMRFSPSEVAVRRGQTVRFVLINRGRLEHEFVLGTPKHLAQHAEMMKAHPQMKHDDPGMAQVKPGASAEIVWQFTNQGTFEYACLMPGHFEAGMVGRVRVK
jgi:uncharacterized cupredoxin-like copper-binding protein